MAICPRTDIFSYFFLTRKINRLYLLTSRPIVVFSRSLNPKTSQKMKTLIHRLGYGLVLLIVVVSCSQPESEEPVIDTSLEVVEVSGEYMDGLMTAYKTFVENLSEEDRAKLDDYVNSIPDRTTSKNSRTQLEASCKCLTTQASCVAKGSLGECCACWDPDTQVGMCGVFAGVGSCEVEERPQRQQNPSQPRPTPGKVTTTVRIFPGQINTLIDYINRSRIGAANPTSISGLEDFKKLLGRL